MPAGRFRRWILLVLIGLCLGLMITHGLPAVAYRVSLAIHTAQQDAKKASLQQNLASLTDTSQAFRMVVERIKPSVAHISAVRLYQGPPASGSTSNNTATAQVFLQEERGSGIIVEASGLVLTNHHVVASAQEIRVQFPGRSGVYRAEIRGYDAATDLALLQVQAPGQMFPVAPLGDSGSVAVGDWVLALGNPFGLQESVTAGIVSAAGNQGLPRHLEVQDYIQTDAAINPGNSGGPLVNLKGEVVGINTAALGEGHRGLGFAIPSSLAKWAVPQLRDYGRIRRGWLGVFLHAVEPDESRARGLTTLAIEVDYPIPNSPAEKGGLQAGDWITALDQQPLADVRSLHRRISAIDPDASVEFTVLRGKESKRLRVQLSVEPEHPSALPGEREWGVQLASLTPELKRWLVTTSAQGVVVTGVHPQQRAARQLTPGDVIISVNGLATPDLDTFARRARNLDLNARVELEVHSREGLRSIILEPRQ